MNKTFMRTCAANYLYFFIGCAGTLFLVQQIKLSPTVASASLGFLFSFSPKGMPGMPIGVYCGSFAGMCSAAYMSGFLEAGIISFAGSLFLSVLEKHFDGVGGKLGAIAFASVSALVFARFLWN